MTPQERVLLSSDFAAFWTRYVVEVGQVRDYVQECLQTPDAQYSRALQDLINHLGHFLGFEVTFGRYQGVKGQVGFDGLWALSAIFHRHLTTSLSERAILVSVSHLPVAEARAMFRCSREP